MIDAYNIFMQLFISEAQMKALHNIALDKAFHNMMIDEYNKVM